MLNSNKKWGIVDWIWSRNKEKCVASARDDPTCALTFCHEINYRNFNILSRFGAASQKEWQKRRRYNQMPGSFVRNFAQFPVQNYTRRKENNLDIYFRGCERPAVDKEIPMRWWFGFDRWSTNYCRNRLGFASSCLYALSESWKMTCRPIEN